MTRKIVIAHTVQIVHGQFPVQAWVEMPLGAKPIGVTPLEDGLGLTVLEDFEGVTVDHELYIFPVAVPVEMPLGFKVGPYIGVTTVGGQPVFVFCGATWPTTIVGVHRAQGHA